jgi:hypothetical protein
MFLIWQAWAKRTGGDEPGALDCLDSAIMAVPPGVVEQILHLIELGALPVPTPDTTDEWLARCREALSGEFAVSVSESRAPVMSDSATTLKPSAPPSPPAESTASLKDDLAAMGWL